LDGFLFECLAVPLFEVSNESLLLTVDRLLRELCLFLKFFKLFVGVTVLLLEVLELAKSLKFFFVDHLSSLIGHLFKSFSWR